MGTYDPMAGMLGSYARGGAFQDEQFPPRGELEHRVPIVPNAPRAVPAQAAWADTLQYLGTQLVAVVTQQPQLDLFGAVAQEKKCV
ncbi:hypothetical protein [Achromobacter insuavis]|uniref:hypothetical protein n=1 Tax=Achromobacter insuavis TaxID=1287735 RepID=UPI001F147E81|nr:hypothetical protein [Achromobacter insuavis]